MGEGEGEGRNASDNPPQHIVRGVALILAAALAISLQDVIFKQFSSELTLWQIFTLRGLLAVPLLLAISSLRQSPQAQLRSALGKWPLARAALITTTFIAFYAALPFLSLSTVGAANYIAPIFITLLSAYAIKESVGPFAWLGVVLGFVGVIVLLQPGTDAFSPWALLPILGAAFYALAHITTRAKCQHVPTASMALSLNLVMLLAGLLVSGLLFTWQPTGARVEAYPYVFGLWTRVDAKDWMVLTILAGFAVAIGMMLAGAYQAAPPAIVSTFEYSYLVFVAVWDILFFGITPTPSSVAGMLMIVAAGLLVLHRSQAKS